MPIAVRPRSPLEMNVTQLGWNLAEELAYLLSVSKLPEADQAAILANAHRFTPDELANLVGVLEAKFADQATQDVDQELARELKGLKSKYADVFVATEQMDRAEQVLAELEFDLQEVKESGLLTAPSTPPRGGVAATPHLRRGTAKPAKRLLARVPRNKHSGRKLR